MAIIKNKKGIFFTFIAILMIMVLMAVFSPETRISSGKDIPVVKTRVTKINDFILNFEGVYLPNIVRSTTHRALTSLTYYMDEKNQFLTDLQPAFSEVFLNGSIGGVQIDNELAEQRKKIMFNNSFLNWTDRIKKNAKDTLNIDLNYSVGEVSIGQTTPWLIDIELEINYSISSETAFWTRNETLIKAKLSIDKLYDPLYYVNTDSFYEKKINQTDIKFGEWNTANLTHFVEEGEYTHWSDSTAPDFLMRFTNNFAASPCCGIESAVNPAKLTAQKNRIYIDYLFFDLAIGDCSNPGILYTINGIPDFKLNFPNVEKYNATKDAAEMLCP